MYAAAAFFHYAVTMIVISFAIGSYQKPTLRSHVVFNNKLLGFKSLCNTLAETNCRNEKIDLVKNKKQKANDQPE